MLARVVLFLLGAALVWATVASAVRTFVLPRGAPDFISGAVFIGMRRLFDLRLHGERQYKRRDRVMAFYATRRPVDAAAGLADPALARLHGDVLGSGRSGTWRMAFDFSGSSLLTLGLTDLDSTLQAALGFSEAAHRPDPGRAVDRLPADYLCRLLATRGSSRHVGGARRGRRHPCVEMIERYHRIHGLGPPA